MTQELLNVVVIGDGAKSLKDLTPEYLQLLDVAKAQVNGLMMLIYHAAENKMGADKLAMTVLGQLFANTLHMVDGAEERQVVAADMANLFENIAIQVEQLETMNEGGSRA